MPDCDRCGRALVDGRDKDRGGWWRDRCLCCIAIASLRDGGGRRRQRRDPATWLDETPAPEGWE